jgi:predicted TIM-barrel fold metal-dependent hydrolase
VLNETCPNGPRFFGSLTLNPPVGGLNPYAVETALRLGAAVVFFPTYSARHQIETMGITGFPDAFPWPRTAESGIQILQMDETPRSEVVAIVELVARYDAVLATGHLSPGESIALLQLARQRGVRRMIVTHASESVPGMSVAEQQEATRCGALIEYCFMAVTDCCPNRISLEEMASQVRQVGVEHVVLSSDFGQVANGPPVEGFGRWLEELLACKFSERELQVMVADNPARLLEGRAKPAA